MTSVGLGGLSGVVLTHDGARAWWSADDPKHPGATWVFSHRVGHPTIERQAHHGDPTAHLHGYPGRGWLATRDGLVLPTHATSREPTTLAEPCRVGGLLVAVLEQPHSPRRALVSVDPSTGVCSQLWAGSDYVAGLTASPDGRYLSWLAWDDPDMPWDSARLVIGALIDGSLQGCRVLAGGPGASAQPATWTSPTTLVTSTEDSGTWQPCEITVPDGRVRRRWSHPHEVGIPYWRAGTRTLATTTHGTIALAGGQLWRLGPTTLEPLDHTGFWSPWLATSGSHALGVRESADTPPTLTLLDIATGARRPLPAQAPGPRLLSPPPVVLTVPGRAGPVEVRLYPPDASPGPFPTVLVAHGGPTLASPWLLDPALRWIPAAGFAVAVVDYTGSAGHGRDFRNALNGHWGDLDVDDCHRAGHLLIARRFSTHLAIRGTSAGGLTALIALGRPSTPFRAGVVYAPVTDVQAQARTTPDFEKSYVTRLMGTTDRSPVTSSTTLQQPVLVIQGTADDIVQPEVTHRYVEQARRRGGTLDYLPLTGAGHLITGPTAARAQAAELTFYRRHLLDPPRDTEGSPARPG